MSNYKSLEMKDPDTLTYLEDAILYAGRRGYQQHEQAASQSAESDKMLRDAGNLLKDCLPFIKDMVGIASAARPLLGDIEVYLYGSCTDNECPLCGRTDEHLHDT